MFRNLNLIDPCFEIYSSIPFRQINSFQELCIFVLQKYLTLTDFDDLPISKWKKEINFIASFDQLQIGKNHFNC